MNANTIRIIIKAAKVTGDAAKKVAAVAGVIVTVAAFFGAKA